MSEGLRHSSSWPRPPGRWGVYQSSRAAGIKYPKLGVLNSRRVSLEPGGQTSKTVVGRAGLLWGCEESPRPPAPAACRQSVAALGL